MKKTLILGASTNPERYSYIAAHRLTENHHEIVPVGIKKGELVGKQIINNKTIQEGIDTITLYLSPENQIEWYDYILKTKPKRIIFNPGTENDELIAKAKNNGIEPIEACTLVMLSVGNY
jgi:hypothetical protein